MIPISKLYIQNPFIFVIQKLTEIYDIDLNILKNTSKDIMNYD